MIFSFTPLLSYGSTVLSIRRKKSSQGFSIDICGTMLVASILRMFYYINDPFEVTLLRQCFVMVFIQVILLRVALKYRNLIRLFDYHYIRPFHYWQWRQPISFWKFLIGFVTFLSLVQIAFNGNEYLGITFGSMSFMIESSLPLPQILLFQRLKHVENFKVILLLSWLGGDFTKISYLFYGTDNVGLIFIIAAFFQMSLNFVITYQFFYY
ncbi:hypothetical protein PICMEDRAFT_28080, partial [Pichia membranifaciens NRRL Y-2026]